MFTLLATCAFGLEALVRRELDALGYAATIVRPGRLRFEGDAKAICRANLWLRTADRVLIEVAEFSAPDFDALFETTRSLPWAAFIPRDGVFPVIGRSRDSQLSSVPACQRAVKKAVAESLLASHNVDSLPEIGAYFRIEIALLKDIASLTLDTTGPSLHKRGYRTQQSAAPLKETLAAALVLLSYWNRTRPLIDPFCGSGTIPIEAALIGQNKAPGLHRDFPSQLWPLLPEKLWQDSRDEAEADIQPGLDERIIGSDSDPRAIAAARRNAQGAGVEELIHFQQGEFKDLSSKRKHGCVITNPPYGDRLGSQRELEQLYQSIPTVLRRLPTWSHYILTAYPNLERVVQKTADRRRKLYNGRIECTYYQFHGPRPPQPRTPQQASDASPRSTIEPDSNSTTEAAGQIIPSSTLDLRKSRAANENQAVFGGLDDKAFEQADIFQARLRKRSRHLRRWPTRRGITCYRIYERDVPEIPLIVDRYEDSLHITEYERPHERDLGQHADWLDLMVRTAAETLQVDKNKVYLKSRQRQRGSLQYERVSKDRHEQIVHEGGLKFLVNLSDYVDTGLFLDHRQTREMVRCEASGHAFLNLFGYTGSFTVYAAAGGASSTMTVDWTHSYLDWARRNMECNGFGGTQHSYVRDDARSFLLAHNQKPTYDLAVVDPPTFSNSKRTDQDWQVQDGHVDLLNSLLSVMNPGGVVFFSSNFRRFQLDDKALEGYEIREITSQTIPEDFRNRRIHRCWRMVCRQERS